jgi:hypothetical protein
MNVLTCLKGLDGAAMKCDGLSKNNYMTLDNVGKMMANTFE